jgi:sugar phosphate isomerase/epimerase
MTTRHTLSRRRFIQGTVASAAVCMAGKNTFAASSNKAVWTIGCLNRPWVKWNADEMLQGVVTAGYKLVGLQTPSATDPFVGPTATREYLTELKQKIASRGLTANVGRLRTKDAAVFTDAIPEIRTQVDNARLLGLTQLLHTGPSKPEHYTPWYRLMNYACGYAADAGVQIVIKPHGGATAAAADLVLCFEKINHANLGLWYDAGNIIFYTGKDPMQELEPLVTRVSAFTAKDCAAKGSEVMIQFGQGKVDFAGILGRLKSAGFKGPIMVESCAVGETAAQTTANAAENRKFLEAVIARL